MNFPSADPKKTRVLVVDDSAVVRSILSRELSRDPTIEVVGLAADPFVARDMVVQLKPDVITLDVEMPRMDGLTFLRKLMAGYPTPTIMLSTLTASGSKTAVEAMTAGAVEILCKPQNPMEIAQLGNELRAKVKSAARARVSKRSEQPAPPPRPLAGITTGHDRIFAIGASTGGVQALCEVIPRLPADAPPIVVVQHMPPKFTASFADRLDKMSQVRVKEAQDGDVLTRGHVLLAPGGFHMVVNRRGLQYQTNIITGDPVHHQRPAVDVLFNSLVKAGAGPQIVAALLTGMGADGADGLLALRQAGARTIAEDEATCVVFGMPMEAIKKGAAERVVRLENVAQAMLDMTAKRHAA